MARSAAQPPRDLPEQLVAGGVAERVVDVLEAVEVEHQDRERQAPPLNWLFIMSSRVRKKARFGSPVRMSVWASSSTRRFASESRRELRLASDR